ncbi:MAG: hypothetical protein ACI9CO_000099 [Candidatus Azotimanducaceae bacterium]
MQNPNCDKVPQFRYSYDHPKYLAKAESIENYLIDRPAFGQNVKTRSKFIALGFDLSLPIEKQLEKGQPILDDQQILRKVPPSRNRLILSLCLRQ